MGVKFEMNWYLVANSLHDIKSEKEGYSLHKDEVRVYPIGSTIPLIYKEDKKCVGLVKITGFSANEKGTKVEFEMVQPFDKFYPVAQHYYSMYESMKTGDPSLIKQGVEEFVNKEQSRK